MLNSQRMRQLAPEMDPPHLGTGWKPAVRQAVRGRRGLGTGKGIIGPVPFRNLRIS